MNATAKRVQRALSMAMAAIVVAPLLLHHTLGAQSATRVSDDPSNHQLVAILDMRSADTTFLAGVQRIVAGGHMDHSAMLHHFRVEALDSAGRPVANDGTWAVTIFADTAPGTNRSAMDPIVQLNASVRDVTLPRPYGCRLHAADSVLVFATFDSTSLRNVVRLRVTVEYEAAERARVAAWTVPGAERDEVARERAYEWRPGVAGEIVAITGLSLAGADRLMLQDAESGEVLWRSHAAADVRAPDVQTVRPNAAVQAGRVYRLTVSYIKAAARKVGPPHGAVHAVVLPMSIKP